MEKIKWNLKKYRLAIVTSLLLFILCIDLLCGKWLKCLLNIQYDSTYVIGLLALIITNVTLCVALFQWNQQNEEKIISYLGSENIVQNKIAIDYIRSFTFLDTKRKKWIEYAITSVKDYTYSQEMSEKKSTVVNEIMQMLFDKNTNIYIHDYIMKNYRQAPAHGKKIQWEHCHFTNLMLENYELPHISFKRSVFYKSLAVKEAIFKENCSFHKTKYIDCSPSFRKVDFQGKDINFNEIQLKNNNIISFENSKFSSKESDVQFRLENTNRVQVKGISHLESQENLNIIG